MATYDVHFQAAPPEEQATRPSKVFTFGYRSAVGVRGAQKLINRWLKCLMTEKGSDTLSPGYGTGYAALIGGNTSNYEDFLDSVAIAVNDCNAQIAALDKKYLPPDEERLSSASLRAVTPRGNDGYDVYVDIRNMAGTVVTTQVPSGTRRS